MLTSLLFATLAGTPPVKLTQVTVDKASCLIIEVRLDDPKVRIGVATASGFPGKDEKFSSIIARSKPYAAITGAYFHKNNLLPIGDIVQNGVLTHSGRMGTAFKLTKDRQVDIERVRRHKTYRWEGFETVLACGPALVLDGNIDVKWQEEGFKDPHVTGKAARMGLGYTVDKRLLLVNVRKAVTFAEFAGVMKKLGCVEAMNLDAGASLAMYCDGKYYAKPSRNLTNVLCVWLG